MRVIKMFKWHKKSKLSEQLKFFGAKKQGFISVYAKKPRIRVKVKVDKPLGHLLRDISLQQDHEQLDLMRIEQARQLGLAPMSNERGGQLADLCSALGYNAARNAQQQAMKQAQNAANRGRALARAQAQLMNIF